MNSIFQLLTLAWTLQGGQYITDQFNISGTFVSKSPFFLDAKFEIQLPISFEKGDKNNIFIGSETESQFFKDSDQLGFDPWQDTYRFNVGARWMGMELGYQHECIHPVLVENIPPSTYFAGYDKVYFKVSGEL